MSLPATSVSSDGAVTRCAHVRGAGPPVQSQAPSAARVTRYGYQPATAVSASSVRPKGPKRSGSCVVKPRTTVVVAPGGTGVAEVELEDGLGWRLVARDHARKQRDSVGGAAESMVMLRPARTRFGVDACAMSLTSSPSCREPVRVETQVRLTERLASVVREGDGDAAARIVPAVARRAWRSGVVRHARVDAAFGADVRPARRVGPTMENRDGRRTASASFHAPLVVSRIRPTA